MLIEVRYWMYSYELTRQSCNRHGIYFCFRVNYRRDNWDLLRSALMEDNKKINRLNR